MSEVSDALEAMKLVFAAADPSPQLSPVAIFKYPEEHANIATCLKGPFPVVIIEEVLYEENEWARLTHDGLDEFRWQMRAFLFLRSGLLKSDPDAAEAEQLQRTWAKAMARSLLVNKALWRDAFTLGNNERKIFDFYKGHFPWWKKTYFGIVFTFPIAQSVQH